MANKDIAAANNRIAGTLEVFCGSFIFSVAYILLRRSTGRDVHQSGIEANHALMQFNFASPPRSFIFHRLFTPSRSVRLRWQRSLIDKQPRKKAPVRSACREIMDLRYTVIYSCIFAVCFLIISMNRTFNMNDNKRVLRILESYLSINISLETQYMNNEWLQIRQIKILFLKSLIYFAYACHKNFI